MAEYRVCTSCERRESEMRSLRSEVERLGRENETANSLIERNAKLCGCGEHVWVCSPCVHEPLKAELAAARGALEKADRFALMAQREIMEALEGEDLQAWLGELYGASIELRDGIARAAAKGGEGSS